VAHSETVRFGRPRAAGIIRPVPVTRKAAGLKYRSALPGYYVYGILHHPEYRSKYAENLKPELPRIPLAKDFWGFAKAGKELTRLHIDYEKLDPYPLNYIETTASFGVRELAPAFVPPKLASAGERAMPFRRVSTICKRNNPPPHVRVTTPAPPRAAPPESGGEFLRAPRLR
jgi:hypothetical protein